MLPAVRGALIPAVFFVARARSKVATNPTDPAELKLSVCMLIDQHSRDEAQINLVLVVTERDVAPGVSKGFVYTPGEPKIGTFRNEHVEFLPKY